MKKKIHPPYQKVLFIDSSTGSTYLISTTLQPKERGMFEGEEYPVCRVPISSSSHPFFTGSGQHIDSEGCLVKFQMKYAKREEARIQKLLDDAEEEAERKKKKPNTRQKSK
jgi:large subunit ribosomal protein L31